MTDHLAGTLPIEQVRMKSYLPGMKIYFSQKTGQCLFGALHVFANSEWNGLSDNIVLDSLLNS